MEINRHTNDHTVTMTLCGRFDFNANQSFREACAAAPKGPGIKELVLDLSQVDYMDSSALGILLMLRQRATANKQRVALSGCTGAVKQMLNVANFRRLFKIT
jgi:HptB-dependent secretion and biofilm anti anti-sigma factor